MLLAVIVLISVSAPVASAAKSPEFTYAATDGKVEITGYAGKGGDVDVPEKIEGLPVSSIGDNAFAGNISIATVSLPRGVTQIGFSAFAGCTGLQSIYLPYNTSSLGDYAFAGCSALTVLSLPDNLTRIGYGAFAGCVSLGSLGAGPMNPVFSSASGILYDKDGQTLVCCPAGKRGFVSVPEGVVAIGDEAFSGCTGIAAVSLPQSLASIGYWAFSGCSGLTGLQLPDNLETIGVSAFSGCTGLRSVTIPDGVIHAGSSAFDGCASLTEILVNEANRTYSSREGVLYDRSGVELIRCPEGRTGAFTIPIGVSIVADWAFSGCAGITSVSIPDSVFSIGEGAFVCGPAWAMSGDAPVAGVSSKLRSIDVGVYNRYFSSSGGALYNDTQSVLIAVPAGAAGSFAIPYGVAAVGDYAFACCTELKDVTIPGTVSSIGKEAFECCAGLSSVTIPSSVTAIGDEAFFLCRALGRAVMENALTRLGADVFKGAADAFKVYYHVSLSDEWADFTAYARQAYCLATVDLQDGSAPAQTAADITSGKLTPPAAPARDGYAFDGWYREAACKTAWDFAKENIQTDVTLFAKWIIAAPGFVRASVASYKNVALSWAAVPGAAGYEVYRSASASGKYSHVKSVTTTSYANTGLTPGKTYYYKIRAYRLVGKSKEYGAYSAAASARPGLGTPRPKASAVSGSAKIAWDAVPGATGYEVWRCGSTGSYKLVSSASAVEYADSGLTAGETYWYKVRAYRTVGGKKTFGAYSGAVSVKP